MPNYRRADANGASYFFTVNTYRRQPFLIDADVRAVLRHGIARVRQTMPFKIEAWVLLPDHMHCIWTLPDGDSDFSSRWRIIKTIVTQSCAERLHNQQWQTTRRAVKRQSTLWQQRFWEHQIRDEKDLINHVDYIHYNPVKHGHAQQVKDWPWSSFHRYVRQDRLPEVWGGGDVEGKFGE